MWENLSQSSERTLFRVAIVGGGISGLSTANRLIELDQQNDRRLNLSIFEASPRLGGTIQTTHRDGFLLERGPDAFISEKPEALSLAKHLGIESQIIQTNEQHRRSFIVRHGRLRPVPEGFQLLAPSRMWPFITSDIFSFSGKLRMAADLLLPRRPDNGNDDESLASFVRRRLGNEALERMAQPMVGGIYTADPELLSLRATLPRFLDMEQSDRSLIMAMWRRGRRLKNQTGVSGARYSLFLSFDQGMEVLTDALSNRIAGFDCDVRLNTRITKLQQHSDGEWSVTTESGTNLAFDAICLAVPAFTAASLLKEVSPSLSSLLNQLKFASTATVNIAYKRSDINHALNGFGFVVPFVEKRSLIACTFSSVKFSGRAPDGYVLLRAFAGGALQPEMLESNDDDIDRQVQSDLQDLLGIAARPLFTEVSRWNKSMPQYEVGHLEKIAKIEHESSKLGGLTLAGNSYRGAGIPDCIKSGEAAAERIVGGKVNR
jgi:oxygen-dependent protoporphyrinogen oxidase